jgi:imidazolonepropionase-like amidohydrolase
VKTLRRVTWIGVAAAAAIANLCAEQIPAPGSGSIAIEHVTVIDVDNSGPIVNGLPGGARKADQTVLVNGNRIASIGRAADVKPPAGARTLDGTGKFLIPGLWEAHFHSIHLEFERTLPIAVARGITGARDMGAPIPYLLRARKAIFEGLLAPRLFVAGPELDGVSSPQLTQFFPPGEETIVETPEEGRKMVDQLADLKVDFIKVHNELKRDVYYAIADESKRKGLSFVGHLPPDVGIVEASDAGQRTIEHMNGLQAACAAHPSDLRVGRGAPVPAEPIEIDQAKCEETARHLARNGTFFSPTPIGAPGQGAPRIRQFNLKIVHMAAQAGVRLLAGTDWPGPGYARGNYSTFDRSPQEEMAGFVEAGLTPLEALRTATVNPAILFNKTADLGSVQKGKLADLVLLDADPLIDINNTARVWAVLVNGRLVDSAERTKILDAEAERRKQVDKTRADK